MVKDTIAQPQNRIQLYEAISTEEGVETACEEKPDIVFMDIGLHSLNGFNAANRIKEVLTIVKWSWYNVFI